MLKREVLPLPRSLFLELVAIAAAVSSLGVFGAAAYYTLVL